MTTTIKETIESFRQNDLKMKSLKQTLSGFRKLENELKKNIQSYLNETNEPGIRIDEKTYISLSNKEKTINLSKKKHEERIRLMLYNRGIEDEEFIKAIFNRTENVIQQQQIKIIKEK